MPVLVVVVGSVRVEVVHFDFFMLSGVVLRNLRILKGLVLNVLTLQNIVENSVQMLYKYCTNTVQTKKCSHCQEQCLVCA